MKTKNMLATSCFYCERTFLPYRVRKTKDHVVPLALGGTSHVDNLVAACGSCNGSKSNYTLLQFKDRLQKTQCGIPVRGFKFNTAFIDLIPIIIRNIEELRTLPHVRYFEKQLAGKGFYRLMAANISFPPNNTKPVAGKPMEVKNISTPLPPVNFHEEYLERHLPPKVTAANPMRIRVGK